jgi:hypothetical protein
MTMRIDLLAMNPVGSRNSADVEVLAAFWSFSF